jgi:hypothetical protein
MCCANPTLRFIRALGETSSKFWRNAETNIAGAAKFALLTRRSLKQPGKAMIHSSRRDRKAKAIAEVLAMLADTHPKLPTHKRCSLRETDEWLWESATEFSAALEKYYAEHAAHIKRVNR